MSAADAKRARTDETSYELLYHNGIPGRAEPIRLAFEQAGVAYSDACRNSKEAAGGMYAMLKADDLKPAHFAPPILRMGDTNISQLPAILNYLGPRLGLAPQDEIARAHILQLTLTALDLQNEVHDTHHPIAVAKVYEDQKDAAALKAADVRNNRIPKFFAHFERTLKANGTDWLYGSSITYADLTLAFVLDGLSFAFPKACKSAKGLPAYPLLQALHRRVNEQPRIKAYLASDRRQAFSMGICASVQRASLR